MRIFAHTLVILFLVAPCPAQAASTRFYGLTLGRRHSQTNTTAPALLSSKAYEARAFVYANTTTTASIKKPNNSVVNLASAGDHMAHIALYDLPALLTSAWPLGNYTISISNPTDGSKASTMYIGGDFYPAAPRVSNFAEAQAVVPGASFILRWDSLVGSTPSDLVQFRLEDQSGVIFETPGVPGVAGALSGSSTSITIPANRLPEGRLLSATISVWRAVNRDTTTIPGALGQAGYFARTTLPIRTRYVVQDVVNYGVQKRVIYNQTGAAPSLRAINPYEMTAFVTGSTTQSVTGATIRSPNNAVTALINGGIEHHFVQAFATPPAMDGAFPAGGHEVQMTTKNNGYRTVTLPVAGNYPQTAPQVVNINESLNIKPSALFTLAWNLNESQPTDHIQVVVTDGAKVVFSTPAVAGAPGAVMGTARSIDIPAGIFGAGKTYTGEICHARVVATDSFTYPMTRGMSSHARVTRFTMKAASGPAPEPTLAPPARVNDQTELTFSSVQGERYMIYTSTTLPAWTAGPTVTAVGPTTVFRFPPNASTVGFYRVGTAP